MANGLVDMQALYDEVATAEFSWKDREYSIGFKPYLFDAKTHADLVQLQENPVFWPMVDALSHLLCDWNLAKHKVDENGKAVIENGAFVVEKTPVTRDEIAKLPIMLLIQMVNSLMRAVTDSGNEMSSSNT